MVENVYVFVSDALRWDYLPESVRRRGEAVKTIAASTVTPTSFSSICSGLNPPAHGVRTFYHQLDPTHNVLHVDGFSTSLWQMIEKGGIYQVLGKRGMEKEHISDIEPPFIHIERELGTHAPYGQWDEEYLQQRRRGSTGDFFGKIDDRQELTESYAEGVKQAADRFEKRLSALENRGLLDDTLVIFTSDHGELLGEYGEWSHSSPLVPELVEVPTVFMHPDGRTSDTELFRHVDLLPTVTDVLDFEIPWTTAGESYYSDQPRSVGYAEYDKPSGATATSQTAPLHRRYRYVVRSVWGPDGGWVFNQSGLADRVRHLPIAAHRLLWPPRITGIGRAPAGFYHHFWHTRRFGTPELSADEAARAVERVRQERTTETATQNLSEEQRDRLQQLGYL